MLDFQRYQTEFTAHIRNPNVHKKPTGVVATRMAVYRNAVFNNIFESASACFPVCQAVIGKRAWRSLVKAFVKSHAAESPIFREIPQQLLQFINAQSELPDYLKQLAHYEWVELAVSSQQISDVALSKQCDLLHEKPVLATAHMLLEYDFAVHKIAQRKLPKSPVKTYFLVFRNSGFEVKFIQLNLITFQLLTLIQENKVTGQQALTSLAEAIQHPNPEAVIQFGTEILADLLQQKAIIGSVN